MDFPRKIYAIKHNKTGRTYIGSSSNVDRRLKNHISALRRGSHIVEDMQDDFNKYGEDYTFSILEEIFEHKDRKKEYEWMKKYQSNVRGIGYNYKDSMWNKRQYVPKYKLTCNGVTHSISDWSKLTGIPYTVIHNRVFERGWDIEKTLTTPVSKKVKNKSNDKIELLNIIRQSDNPEQTILKLFEMITSLLE